MKRIISIIASAALLFTLFSCGKEKNRTYDREEVIAAAETLIKRSESLNEIFWGEGIGYYEDDNYKNGYYYPADPQSLKEYGFETVDDIIERAGKVFSDDYLLSIYSSVFSSYETMSGYSRYYQDIDCIMVYTRYIPLITDDIEYLYNTLTDEGSVGDTVYVKITVRVTRGGDTQTRELKIGLIEEDDGWRIDTPTYTTYHQSNS